MHLATNVSRKTLPKKMRGPNAHVIAPTPVKVRFTVDIVVKKIVLKATTTRYSVRNRVNKAVYMLSVIGYVLRRVRHARNLAPGK